MITEALNIVKCILVNDKVTNFCCAFVLCKQNFLVLFRFHRGRLTKFFILMFVFSQRSCPELQFTPDGRFVNFESGCRINERTTPQNIHSKNNYITKIFLSVFTCHAIFIERCIYIAYILIHQINTSNKSNKSNKYYTSNK